ncbi:MAG: hypothetical protein HZB25_09135 [Candidatus Eisenbacteria bacterium]|nr:hypothetical protein [Candidatus Eisenbacteria bacterium]
MDRPSSIAARARQRRNAGLRWRSRPVLSLVLLAMVLAFAHVWENVTVAELRTRIDRERNSQDQLGARLHQLTAQLAEWRAQAESAPGASTRMGFTIPGDKQVCLLSVGTMGGSRAVRLASGPKSLWDWLATTAEAESRGPSKAAPGPEAETLP